MLSHRLWVIVESVMLAWQWRYKSVTTSVNNNQLIHQERFLDCPVVSLAWQEPNSWVCFLRNYPTAQVLSALLRRSGINRLRANETTNFWGKSFAAVETEHEVPSQTYLPETYHETQSRAQKRLFKEETAVSVPFICLLYLVLVFFWGEKRPRIGNRSLCGEKRRRILRAMLFITSHIVNKQRSQAVYKEQSRR